MHGLLKTWTDIFLSLNLMMVASPWSLLKYKKIKHRSHRMKIQKDGMANYIPNYAFRWS